MDRSAIDRALTFYEEVTLRRNLFTPPTGFSSRLPFESAELVREAWNLYIQSGATPRIALYVHVPFCAASKCAFCMYYSRPMPSSEDLESYLNYLEHAAGYFAPAIAKTTLESLYVGGGTPSILTLPQLDRLLERVVGQFRFHPEAERTFESSFQTCSHEKLRLIRDKGINRVSFGLESVEGAVLDSVARRRTDETMVRDQVGFARELGFAEVNVDLLIGLPHETADGLSRGFHLAVGAGAHSVTVYVYRHRSPVPADALAKYNSEHVPTLLAAARTAAIALGWIDTVQNDHTEYQFFTTSRHLRDYSLLCYRTRPDPLCGNSTLGLGHTATSFIADFFRAECRDKSAAFDPTVKSWVVETIATEQRRRLFVTDALNRAGFVDERDFSTLFGLDLRQAFPEEIAALETIGKGTLARGRFELIARDRLELATLSKFFWDQQYLRELVGENA